jgi:hypothetical protein
MDRTCSTHWIKKKCYKILDGTSQRERLLRGPSCRWKIIIKWVLEIYIVMSVIRSTEPDRRCSSGGSVKHSDSSANVRNSRESRNFDKKLSE